MVITGIGNNYNNIYESTYAAQKNEAAKEKATDSVSDYYSYLQKNYDCIKNGNVAISGSYLRQCANNSEKAKELEETLSLYNDIRDRGYANAKQNAQRLGARLVSYSESWSIDDTGNITMTASATVTSDTKGWKELKEEQEERLKEKKETRRTAADELSYLSEKYSDITFVAVNYKQGMQYGSMATTNIAISPAFLKKMANNPELEKEYESYFEGMQKLDEENIRTHEARGRRMVAQGWAIDKDGGISRWGISEPTDKRHHGQEMTDYANKIREQKSEKRREQEKIEEKRQASQEEKEKLQEKLNEAGREQFGDKWKGAVVMNKEDEKVAVSKADKDNAAVAGLNMDLKA